MFVFFSDGFELLFYNPVECFILQLGAGLIDMDFRFLYNISTSNITFSDNLITADYITISNGLIATHNCIVVSTTIDDWAFGTCCFHVFNSLLSRLS